MTWVAGKGFRVGLFDVTSSRAVSGDDALAGAYATPGCIEVAP